MLTYFKYKGFEPTHEIEMAAAKALARITSVESNQETTVVARVEFDGQGYGCSVDIFRKFASLYVFVIDPDPIQSIVRAVEEMEVKMIHTQTAPVAGYQKFIQRRSKETYFQ